MSMALIDVFAAWDWLESQTRIGILRAEYVHGRETFSFEYDLDWLQRHDTLLLDPELLHFEGPQYLGDRSKQNFGIFLDSSPDRWGRLLMKRREAVQAREQGTVPRMLRETDFLLGVHDQQRMGGLRFRISGESEEPFLSDRDGENVPPWTRLRELEQAAWQLQSEGEQKERDLREWMNLLIAPGSSIGGARPKAGVCDETSNLWIAKFPGRNDEHDVGGWEMVLHTLAGRAGLRVTEARAERFASRHHTFLTRRFDRSVINGKRARRHFASAMTMLGYSDGIGHDDGASYLEIVEFLARYGANPSKDLPELWRRILFSIAVSNTDDHLRNHGFILDQQGWRLSPAYDLNPNPTGTGLHLNISETDNSLSFDLARSVAPFFRVHEHEQASMIQQVNDAVGEWRSIAQEIGISRTEQELMMPAFRR